MAQNIVPAYRDNNLAQLTDFNEIPLLKRSTAAAISKRKREEKIREKWRASLGSAISSPALSLVLSFYVATSFYH